MTSSPIVTLPMNIKEAPPANTRPYDCVADDGALSFSEAGAYFNQDMRKEYEWAERASLYDLAFTGKNSELNQFPHEINTAARSSRSNSVSSSVDESECDCASYRSKIIETPTVAHHHTYTSFALYSEKLWAYDTTTDNATWPDASLYRASQQTQSTSATGYRPSVPLPVPKAVRASRLFSRLF